MKHSRIKRNLIVMLWCSVVGLGLFGVVLAIGRGFHVVPILIAHDQPHSPLSPFDHVTVQMIAAGRNVEPGTKAYQEFEADVSFLHGKYTKHPVVTLGHVLAGGLLLILVPLQLSTRVRARHIRFHRWSGRFLLLVAVLASLSGLFFGLLPEAANSPATFIFGIFFLFAVTRAFISIRRHDVARHREWMIRMFSVAVGITIVRLVDGVLFAFTTTGPLEAIWLSFWIGGALSLAVAELWIRYTREPHAPIQTSVLTEEALTLGTSDKVNV